MSPTIRLAALLLSAIAFGAAPVHASFDTINGTGSHLTVTLISGNHFTLSSNGSNIVLDGGAQLSNATYTTLTIIGDSAGGEQVTLDGVLSFPGGVTVSGVDTLYQAGDYDVGPGGYTATVAQGIIVGTAPGTTSPVHRISSTSGNISLTGTGQAITVDTATLTSTSGNISLAGQTVALNTATLTTSGSIQLTGTGVTQPVDPGVALTTSTISASTNGSIAITGTGGNGSSGNTGVFISGSTLGTVDGSISVVGTGGSAGSSNVGVNIAANASGASSSLSATGSGSVMVSGTGGSPATGSNYGFLLGDCTVTPALLFAGDCTIATVTGDIVIRAVGGGGVNSTAFATGFGTTAFTSTGAGSISFAADSTAFGPSPPGPATTINGPHVLTSGDVTFTTATPSTPIQLCITFDCSFLQSNVTASTRVIIGDTQNTGGIQVAGSFTVNTPTISMVTAGPYSGPGAIVPFHLQITDASSSGHAWQVNGTQIQEDGNTPFFTTFPSDLRITGGSGSDTFTVTPSTAGITPLVIDGGTPTPAANPGDVLNIVPGAPAPVLTYAINANGYSGQVFFGNPYDPVYFQNIESGNVAPAQLLVSAPATATAGSALSFTVTAADIAGNTATYYNGTVHFTTSDGSSILPADSTLTNGTGTFSATLDTPGGQTITATDAVVSSVTGTSNTINVSAAAATHFAVSAPASVSVGSVFSFTVTALDQFNNTATSYAGTVHFTSSDGQATLPADSTLAGGAGTFNATLKTAGSQSITATDTVSSSVTGTSGAIAVGATAATHYTVSAPVSAVAGSAFSFTVTALDQFNNTATGYSGTVHFTASDGQAILPTDSTLAGGVGTFSATLKTAGNQTITATDTVTSSITGPSNTVNVSAAAATHFTVSAPGASPPNTAFNFTVTALDQNNNTATGYLGVIHFTSTDGAAILPANSTLPGGTGTFSATLKTLGSQTITATDTVTSPITGTSGAITVASKSFSAPSPTGGGTITASFTGGGASCAFASPQFIGPPPGSHPVPPTVPAAGARFPFGLFDFSLVNCTPGSTVTMTIAYPASVDRLRYWKYGPEGSNPAPHWYVLPATVSGNTIVFTLTDGGAGDDDLTANGTFVDQGGPGLIGADIPTLSEWMLLLLALGVLATGIRAQAWPVRRRA
jgi:hypothetical protein